jgi:hypothetical protein
MKRLLSRVLAACGLISARQYDALSREANGWKTKSAEWKARASKLEARARALDEQLQRQIASAREERERTTEFERLRERLEIAERELVTAREQLMAVEVKLDILEGAANVLDLRTRAAISREHSGSGAAV